MRCPVCEKVLPNNGFQYIGSGKRICSSCQAILNVGYLCPVCFSFADITPVGAVPDSAFAKFFARIKFTFNQSLKCDTCGFQASYRTFPRILYQNEKYSLID